MLIWFYVIIFGVIRHPNVDNDGQQVTKRICEMTDNTYYKITDNKYCKKTDVAN